MEAKTLNVEVKTEVGKNVNNRLRSSGFIPAVIYSHGKCDAIKVQKKEFKKIFKGHISESLILNLNITGKSGVVKEMAFIKDYQKEPVSGEIIHLDFYKVVKDEKIHTMAELHIVGTPKGVKLGGILEVYDREIKIECFPGDLPEKIEVDVTNLGMDDTIHVKDLNLGDKIKILTSLSTLIAAVHEAKAAPEPGEEAAEAAAAETEEAKAE